jgi:hypothetical protein
MAIQPPTDNPLLRLSVDLGPDAIIGGHITAAISPDGTRLAFPVHGSVGIGLAENSVERRNDGCFQPG